MKIYTTLLLLTLLSIPPLLSQDHLLENMQAADFIKKDKYDGWLRTQNTLNLAIKDPDETWVFKVALHRWNRFVSTYQMLPKDADVIQVLFDEAMAYQPHYFCDGYQDHIRDVEKWTPLGKKHYFRQRMYMDSVCSAVLTYEEADLKAIAEIEDNYTKYRSSIFYGDEGSHKEKQQAVDSLNLLTLLKWIEKNGYPGIAEVGLEYDHVAWRVLLTGTAEVIERHLPMVKQQIENRNLMPWAYPRLYDRLCVLKGEPQLYGTQKHWNKITEQFEVYPIKELELLEERRYRWHLPSFDESSTYRPVLDGK